MKLLPFRVDYHCSIFNFSRWINSSNVYRHTTDIYYDNWGYHCHGNKWVWRTPIIDIYNWVRSSYLLVQRKIVYQFIYVQKSIYNLVSMLYYRYGTIYIILSIPSDNKYRLIELSMLYHDTTVLSSYLCYIRILPSYRVIYVISGYYRLIELSMLYQDTTVLSSYLCYIMILPSYQVIYVISWYYHFIELSMLYHDTTVLSSYLCYIRILPSYRVIYVISGYYRLIHIYKYYRCYIAIRLISVIVQYVPSYRSYIAIRTVLSVLYCNTYRLIEVILQYVPSYRSYFTMRTVLSMLFYNK